VGRWTFPSHPRTDNEPDMLRAFEAGADDFIARPARYLELRGFISSKDRELISSTSYTALTKKKRTSTG
jgi:PleD family two-component response regulator